jgi:hypothetical protein
MVASDTAFTKANDITRTANIAFFVMPITAARQQVVRLVSKWLRMAEWA